MKIFFSEISWVFSLLFSLSEPSVLITIISWPAKSDSTPRDFFSLEWGLILKGRNGCQFQDFIGARLPQDFQFFPWPHPSSSEQNHIRMSVLAGVPQVTPLCFSVNTCRLFGLPFRSFSHLLASFAPSSTDVETMQILQLLAFLHHPP